MNMWKNDREHPPTKKENAKRKCHTNSAPFFHLMWIITRHCLLYRVLVQVDSGRSRWLWWQPSSDTASTVADLHLDIFTSADLLFLCLSLLLSLSLSLSLFFSRSSFLFLLMQGQCRRSAAKHDRRSVSCTSDVQNLDKIAILKCPEQPFRTKWMLNVKNCGKIAILMRRAQPSPNKLNSSTKKIKHSSFLMMTYIDFTMLVPCV